jgi:hypothetical protein
MTEREKSAGGRHGSSFRQPDQSGDAGAKRARSRVRRSRMRRGSEDKGRSGGVRRSAREAVSRPGRTRGRLGARRFTCDGTDNCAPRESSVAHHPGDGDRRRAWFQPTAGAKRQPARCWTDLSTQRREQYWSRPLASNDGSQVGVKPGADSCAESILQPSAGTTGASLPARSRARSSTLTTPWDAAATAFHLTSGTPCFFQAASVRTEMSTTLRKLSGPPAASMAR